MNNNHINHIRDCLNCESFPLVTIRDVSKHCGVSAMTVSHVLNNTATISDTTRARVMAAIKELNYQPSIFARGLMGRRTNIVGLAFSDVFSTGASEMPRGIAGTYYADMLDGVIMAATPRHYDVMLFTWRLAHTNPMDRLRYCSGICDGLVLVAPKSGTGIVSSLLATSFPFVIVSDNNDDPRISCFDIDNILAARTATEHLLDLGHRNIVAVELGDDIGCNQPRIDGYREALENRGIAFDPEMVVLGTCPEWSQPQFEESFHRLFRRCGNDKPTAIFCFGDRYAIYAMDIVRSMGLRVPEDVSVIGINDESLCQLSVPPLTTIRQPLVNIARRAADTLFEIISGSQPAIRKEIFPCELVERQSTAPRKIS